MRAFLGLICVLALVSCGAGGSVPATGNVTDTLSSGIPAISDLPLRSVSDFDKYLNGSEFLGAKNVVADGDLGIFSPTRSEGTGEYAYGLYMFSLNDFEGDCYVLNEWEVAPAAEELYIGLPNRVNQEWEWFQPGPGIGVYIADVATYVNELNALYVIALLAGHGDYSLDYLQVSIDAPYTRAITPRVSQPGTLVQFSADCLGCEPLAYTWDFGDMATPSTSNEATPTVEITSVEGSYTVSLLVSNELGGEPVEYEIAVSNWQQDLPIGKLAVTPLQSTAVVGEAVPIIVYCGDFPADAPMCYMTGVAVTCEVGGDFVDNTFNLGLPGGVYSDYDGCWAAMQPVPSKPFKPYDGLMHAQPVTGQPDLVYFGFTVVPIHGSNITAGGALMNCCLTFDTPGTYHLGLLAQDQVMLTYYSDETAANYNWLDISNDGIANTIVVTAE